MWSLGYGKIVVDAMVAGVAPDDFRRDVKERVEFDQLGNDPNGVMEVLDDMVERRIILEKECGGRRTSLLRRRQQGAQAKQPEENPCMLEALGSKEVPGRKLQQKLQDNRITNRPRRSPKYNPPRLRSHPPFFRGSVSSATNPGIRRGIARIGQTKRSRDRLPGHNKRPTSLIEPEVRRVEVARSQDGEW